jgi:hypothetical protein
LEHECVEDFQIAYNVICALWVISYHPFAMTGFEDFSLSIIEKVAKVLDFFNKEKIVRIVLMLFDVRPTPALPLIVVAQTKRSLLGNYVRHQPD